MLSKEAKSELWRRGVLIWKANPVQKEMYKIFYAAQPRSRLVWLVSRQLGKSFLLAILALEQALRTPHSIVKLATDTKLHLKSIFEKIFEELLTDCPQDIKPEFKEKSYSYYFPNGSQIQLAGTDGKHYEKLRGQKAHLVLIDEAGFCNDLDTVVHSVLFPTTTHTGGKMVLASTPPEELDHEFIKFIERAEYQNFLTKKTIYENPALTPEDIDRIIEEMGGLDNERFRREYLCELVKDPNSSVIPEFDEDLEKEIVKEWPKPPFFDTYVSMDLGGKDLTAVVFGYYDFRADKLIIEDELIMDFKNKEETIAKLTQRIQEKEKALWTDPYTLETKKPFFRVSDIDYLVIREILKYSNNQMVFHPAQKDTNATMINDLRHMLSTKKIIINPKCKTLIRHLKHVRWDSKTNKHRFARSPDNGHFDAVDSLKYMIRCVAFGRNPYPSSYDAKLKDMFGPVQDKMAMPQIEVFKRIFNIKPRRC